MDRQTDRQTDLQAVHDILGPAFDEVSVLQHEPVTTHNALLQSTLELLELAWGAAGDDMYAPL